MMAALKLVAPEEREAAVLDAIAADVDAGDDKQFWDAAPGLAAIQDWARARRAGPYALLGEILLQVGARIPPQVVLPPLGAPDGSHAQGAASLNQLLASVGPSGQSKGLCHQLATEVVDWPPGTPPRYESLGSGEGIAATYVACIRDPETREYVMTRLAWSAVFAATEVDKLAALLGRRAATLGGVLRSAWSGEPLGEANASEERRRRVPRHGYRCGIVVHVQPGRGGALLNADEEAAGTPQRVLWLPAMDPGIPDVAPPPPGLLRWRTPPEITDAIGKIEASGLESLGIPDLVVLPVASVAREAIDRAAVARHRGEAGVLDGHALLVQEKLAAVLAAFLGRFGITDEDWELAGHLMAVSDSTRRVITNELRRAADERNEAQGRAEARRAQIVTDATAKNALHSAKNRVVTILRKSQKGQWVALGQLRQQSSSAQRDCLSEAIEELLQEETIDVRATAAGHGVTGTEYAIRAD